MRTVIFRTVYTDLKTNLQEIQILQMLYDLRLQYACLFLAKGMCLCTIVIQRFLRGIFLHPQL